MRIWQMIKNELIKFIIFIILLGSAMAVVFMLCTLTGAAHMAFDDQAYAWAMQQNQSAASILFSIGAIDWAFVLGLSLAVMAIVQYVRGRRRRAI